MSDENWEWAERGISPNDKGTIPNDDFKPTVITDGGPWATHNMPCAVTMVKIDDIQDDICVKKPFAVMQLEQNYDYVEDIIHVKSFFTEEEANAFIREKKKERSIEIQARNDYIEKWVDAICVFQMSYQDWVKFLRKYQLFYYVSPDNFKKEFKRFLRNDFSFKFEGYDPPVVNLISQKLRVVEMKDER